MGELYILLLQLNALTKSLQHLCVLLRSLILCAALPSSILRIILKTVFYCQGLWNKEEERLFTPVAGCYFTLLMPACLKIKEA